jgi:hypothetical protein
MQLSCRRDWAGKISCIFELPFFNTQRARRLFSPPQTLKQIRYFDGPAVDRDVSQPKGLEFRYIQGRLAGASFEEPNHLLQVIEAIFQSIEKVTLGRVFQEWMDK